MSKKEGGGILKQPTGGRDSTRNEGNKLENQKKKVCNYDNQSLTDFPHFFKKRGKFYRGSDEGWRDG